MRDRSDPPPSKPTPAPLKNFGTCPECGAATGNGQHVCKPKVATS